MKSFMGEEKTCVHNRVEYAFIWKLEDQRTLEGLEELLMGNCLDCHSTISIGYEYLVTPKTSPAIYVRKDCYARHREKQ